MGVFHVFKIVHIFFYNIIDYNWTRQKINNKLQRDTKIETRKYNTSTYLATLSNRTVKKESGGGENQREKNEYIFKAKERNNIKAVVLKIYF